MRDRYRDRGDAFDDGSPESEFHRENDLGYPVPGTYEVVEVQVGDKWAHVETEQFRRLSGEDWWMAHWSCHRVGLSMVCRRGDTKQAAIQQVIDDLVDNGFGGPHGT